MNQDNPQSKANKALKEWTEKGKEELMDIGEALAQKPLALSQVLTYASS